MSLGCERDFIFDAISNCEQFGYPPEVVKEVWRQIESFGSFSFCKAHSASFAVESYQSLYLKTYFPHEFHVAVINNFGGFYSRELYFLELRKTGAVIHLPCVNESDEYTNIKGNDVYAGFIHIKSLQQEAILKLLDERKSNGNYLHLQDFIQRTGITGEQLNALVSIGAFRFTGRSKKELLWEANFLQSKITVNSTVALFSEPPVTFTLPAFKHRRIDDLYDELELLDFPLCNPFELVDDDPSNYPLAKELTGYLNKNITVLGYFIESKRVSTIKNEVMAFASFLDVELNWLDTIHFPPSLRSHPFTGRGFYRITGKVVVDFGVYNIEVGKMEKVGLKRREGLK